MRTLKFPYTKDGVSYTRMISCAKDGVSYTRMISCAKDGVSYTRMISYTKDGVSKRAWFPCVTEFHTLNQKYEIDEK